MKSFQLVGLHHDQFEPLFELGDDELLAIGASRQVATASPGFPCRVCLDDANVGDELLLFAFTHQPALSPYRSSGPIFIRRGAHQRTIAPGQIPPYVSRRVISVRSYDAAHIMIAAAITEGSLAKVEIERQFSSAEVAYIHLHNAARGCFSCRVDRA